MKRKNHLKNLLLGTTLAVFLGACSDGTTGPAEMMEGDGEINLAQSNDFTDVSHLITTVPDAAQVFHRQVNFPNNADACAYWGIESDFGGKIDTGNPGTYTIPGTDIEVTLEDLGSNTYAVSVQSGYVMTDIFLKHRVDFNEWYRFVPGVTSASGMQTGQNALSHFSVCVNEAAFPLEVEKDAFATFDRTVEWELEKTVDPETHTGYAGEFAGSSTWTVEATKTETLGNYKVDGTITITNPNDIPVEFEVSDELDDGTVAEVTCPTYTVGANDHVICTYEAEPEDGSATENTVVVTSLTEGVAGGTAKADLDWIENLIGYDEGTLSDPRVDFEELISSSTTETFDEDFYCSADAGDYTNGHYQYTETNTAYLNGNLDLEDSATVTVDCYLPALEVEKTADGTYYRTVEWELEKLVDGQESVLFSGAPGDEFYPTWQVTATKIETFGEVEVTGTITITNPASIEQEFTIEDVLDDGTVAEVECESYAVAAGENVTCTYTASPADADAEENIATVTAEGNEPQEGRAAIVWDGVLNGFNEGTLSDPRFEFEELISSSTTETFDETFYCPPLDSGEYVDGFYYLDVVNWAYLNDYINLEASAAVRGECAAPVKGYTAWAANGDDPLEYRYTPRGNWATYVEYDEKTVTLFAGQFHAAGTVTFSAPDNDTITITINLDSGWMFEDVAENVKIQDYEFAPSGNPQVGLFAHKGEGSGPTFSITVPANNFYGVHVNVMGPENP